MKVQANPLLSLFLLIVLLVAMAFFDILREKPTIYSRDRSEALSNLQSRAVIYSSDRQKPIGIVKRAVIDGYAMQSIEFSSMPANKLAVIESWVLSADSSLTENFINTGKLDKLPDGRYFGYFETKADLNQYPDVVLTLDNSNLEFASAKFLPISSL